MREKKIVETECFDAVVTFPPQGDLVSFPVVLRVEGRAAPAELVFYERPGNEKSEEYLVQVFPHRPLSLRWKDSFEVEESRERKLLGRGIVLNPLSSKVSGKKVKKRLELLSRLQGGEREMLSALLQEKGVNGLREHEVLEFVRLSPGSLRKLSEEMEEEGTCRILSFSPLFIIWKQSLSFLQAKILSYLGPFHQKHPAQKGVLREKIGKRFNVHQRVLSLALEQLIKQGKIGKSREVVALSTFTMTLTPEDECILHQLEEMCLKGEFRSASQEELQQRFHLSPEKLSTMLSLLIEREKIVQGKEGFFIHSHWLDEVISQLRKSGKKELTVADFKQMTGLTRKYAIPLLELLDQMGVTHRISPSRRVIE